MRSSSKKWRTGRWILVTGGHNLYVAIRTCVCAFGCSRCSVMQQVTWLAGCSVWPASFQPADKSNAASHPYRDLPLRLTDSSKWKSPQTAHAPQSGSLAAFFFNTLHACHPDLSCLSFTLLPFFSPKFAAALKALILAPCLFDKPYLCLLLPPLFGGVNVFLHLLIILSLDLRYLSCTFLFCVIHLKGSVLVSLPSCLILLCLSFLSSESLNLSVAVSLQICVPVSSTSSFVFACFCWFFFSSFYTCFFLAAHFFACQLREKKYFRKHLFWWLERNQRKMKRSAKGCDFIGNS